MDSYPESMDLDSLNRSSASGPDRPARPGAAHGGHRVSRPARPARAALLLAVAVVVVALGLALLGARGLGLLGAHDAPEGAAPPAPVPSPASPSPAGPREAHVTIGYAGDVLPHMPVMDDTAGGGGDIEPLIAPAAPWSSGVDLALCGMEVPVSPDGVPSGYPVFGTTPTLVQALSRSGWDGCATASNHAWDKGFEGVTTTADALAASGMGYSGTNRTEAESATPYQLYDLTRDGMTITVAQLSSTYGLNGFSADPAWAVNLNDVVWVDSQARAARQAGADVVVLHAQLGEEYSAEPVAEQRQFAQAVAATGQVDVLFGAHPHVPETNELVPGGPGGRGMWASYSAGNFISNQSEELGSVLTAIGLFVWVDVTVTEDAEGRQEARVDALHWHPFTVDTFGGHELIDLGAAARGEVPEGSSLGADELTRRFQEVSAVVNAQTYSEEPPAPAAGAAAPVVRPRG